MLSPAEIERALDPARYLGSTDAFINKAFEAYHEFLPVNIRKEVN
jgi:hypothetical protein